MERGSEGARKRRSMQGRERERGREDGKGALIELFLIVPFGVKAIVRVRGRKGGKEGHREPEEGEGMGAGGGAG